MKEMQFTVERGGPLLPFLLEHVKGSRNHVKSLLARGQVQVDGAAVRRHDHIPRSRHQQTRRKVSRAADPAGSFFHRTSPPILLKF